MGYPSSIKSFTLKRNNIDKVIADDVNLAYTEITEIERQLGGITTTSGGSAGVGVVKSDWGVGTFGTGITNWYSNDGLAARLKNIEAGLYQTLVTGSILGTTIPSSKTLVVTTDKLSVHATTTSAELAGVISGTTGSGSLVFGTAPTLTSVKLASASLGTVAAGNIEYDGTALYYTQSTTTGRAVVQATNYYTYYGNSSLLGGITAPYGFKTMTLAPYTAYEYEGMYVFSFNETPATNAYPIFKIQGTSTIANSAFTVTYWCTTSGSLSATTARSISETYAVGNTNITLENTSAVNTARVGIVKWKGTLRNQQATTGTVYATIMGSATATVTMIKDGSYIKLTPIGVDTIAANGAW